MPPPNDDSANVATHVLFPADGPLNPGREDLKSGGPVAWLNPKLLSFAGRRTTCPPELIPEMEGTVGWGVDLYSDGSVTDKAGVEHQPRPLVEYEDYRKLALAVRYLARRCDEQGFYSVVRQPVVQGALAAIAQMEAHLPQTGVLASGEPLGADS